MSISLQGFDCKYATFKLTGDPGINTLVNVSGNATVSAAVEGAFTGVLISKHNGNALVQLSGYVRVPYAEPEGAPALGYGYVTMAAADGAIAPAGSGRQVTVVDLDETAQIAGIIL